MTQDMLALPMVAAMMTASPGASYQDLEALLGNLISQNVAEILEEQRRADRLSLSQPTDLLNELNSRFAPVIYRSGQGPDPLPLLGAR
ncbi:hypothetical protein [Gallaecimonas sp. GXIMD4217]|uniref:hypothetical protein n=1 Tax=Gallaecimonas sp. GXIMD4217 TaxID=3131927 RepID=UPI00311B0280